MAITNTKEIDSIGIEKKTGKVDLILKDDLDWSNKEEHFLLLEGKLNVYIHFIESGQIFTAYPLSKNKSIKITIYSKYQYPEIALDFIKHVSSKIDGLGIELDYKFLDVERH